VKSGVLSGRSFDRLDCRTYGGGNLSEDLQSCLFTTQKEEKKKIIRGQGAVFGNIRVLFSATSQIRILIRGE
jgi:hypothetical protein